MRSDATRASPRRARPRGPGSGRLVPASEPLSMMPNLTTEAGFTGGTPQVLEVVASDHRSEVWVHLVHGCSFGCCWLLLGGEMDGLSRPEMTRRAWARGPGR